MSGDEAGAPGKRDGASPIPAEEQLFAELVVEQGLCTRERVEKCIAELRELGAQGVSPLPRLGDLLIKHGYLSPGASPKPQMVPVGIGRGHRCGSYLLVQKIGAGGMGEVWKARDMRLDRAVALKFLIGTDPEEVTRFLREAKLAAELNHPNIAPIYEVGEAAGHHFIAMHLVKGEILKPCARGEERQTVVRLRQAALGVAHAHTHGIVHRDIKPANIMVEEGEGAERVYVMDFGLARRESKDSKLTASGNMVGTPAYMPPEQARGALAEIDGRSDVYSFGATMYELLTGTAPFTGSSVYEIVMKVCNEEPVRPSDVRKGLDADLETIILKCLEKDRERRYASMAEFAAELERWLNGDPIAARPPTLTYRLKKAIGRRRVVLGAAAALLVVIAIAAVTVGSFGREARFREDYAGAIEAWSRATLVYRAESIDQGSARNLMTDALSRFEKLAADHPDRPEGPYMAGRALKLLGRTEDAVRAWTRALEIAPAFHLARFERGKSRLETSIPGRAVEIAAARVHFRATRAETAEEAERRRQGEEDLAAVRASGALGAGEARYLEGALALGEERWSAAAEAFQRFADDNPWEADAFAMLAFARLRSGRLGEAVESLDKAVRLSERPLWLRQRALARHATGDQTGALSDCDRLARMGDQDEDLILLRSMVLQALSRHADAEGELTRALTASPQSARLWNRRGVVRLDRGDRAGAESDIEEAMRLDPSAPAVYHNLGTLRVLQGRLDEAVEEYTTGIGIDATHVALRFSRAKALLLLHRAADAVEDLRAGLVLAPGDPDGLFQLAEALDIAGKRGEAIEAMRKALENAPKDWKSRAAAEAKLNAWR